MEYLEKAKNELIVIKVIQSLQSDQSTWVDLANIGVALAAEGFDYKRIGFPKLKPFLEDFQDAFEFKNHCEDGKPPICYVRPKGEEMTEINNASSDEPNIKSQSTLASERVPVNNIGKFPTNTSWLFNWATISSSQIEKLAELALTEKWYYGETQPETQEKYPILKNYLGYTFKKLCNEGKVQIENDLERDEEYAAFNTGLVDQKYEYIYALLKHNTLYQRPYWYLVAFVVAGEDAGKTLVNLFNPLPSKADFFRNKIENMLYNTSTGELSCDYMHILIERTYRLPINFYKDNCPNGFTSIDGIEIDDIYENSDSDDEKRYYFKKLGEKIQKNSKILNRLKNRMDDAVKLALKRVEWNYKTAIPMYFPARDTMSFLLPLALVDEDRVDLALVVERKQSGAYQGQTVLPLDLAYSNSRLVTRPDSDWLKTDVIKTSDSIESDCD